MYKSTLVFTFSPSDGRCQFCSLSRSGLAAGSGFEVPKTRPCSEVVGLKSSARMAQWLASLTLSPKIVGSKPSPGAWEFLCERNSLTTALSEGSLNSGPV